jgi:hypothetical protein
MSDPVVPSATEPPAPPKKKKTGKILLIVAVVLLVVCGGLAVLGYTLLNKAVDAAYAEGSCIDSMSTSATGESTAIPNSVPCTDPKAVGKILKVADGKSANDGESVCGSVPGVTSYTVLLIKGGTTKLLCLGPK